MDCEPITHPGCSDLVSLAGALLLSGLFFYDIFWVFGTPVMVTVAKSLDAPIKLLFPRAGAAAGESPFAMLGLGDIVIPGIFVALCLRYDAKHGSRYFRRCGPPCTFT